MRDTEYIFKHALTQEVASNSVLVERRKALHERAGQALESMFSQHLVDHLGELAHHYSRSGNRTKAVDYLTRAGTQTARRSAYPEGTQQLARALEILKELPPGRSRDSRELKLQSAMGSFAFVSQGEGSGDVGKALARALELAVTLDDRPRRARALLLLGYHHVVRGELRRASEISQDLYKLCQEERNPELDTRANHLMGLVTLWMGEFRKAERHTGAAAREDPALTRVGIRGQALAIKGIAIWNLGFPDQALALAKEALMLGEDAEDPYNSAGMLYWAGIIHLNRGELVPAEHLFHESLNRSAEQGFAVMEAIDTATLGLLSALRGQAQAGLEQLGRCLEIFARQRAAGQGQRYILAQGYASAGKPDEAFAILTGALEWIERSGAEAELASMHLLKGHLSQSRANSEEAENSFRTSIEIARRQSAKSWQLRATTSLAQLLRDTNRCEEGRAMLAEIYNWFTEGFDTADLKDAKALLDELSA